MSKETKNFTVVIMDNNASKVKIFNRVLPKDIQTTELEEILETEGVYKSSECYLMFGDACSITLEDNR